MALSTLPELLNEEKYPLDVKERFFQGNSSTNFN